MKSTNRATAYLLAYLLPLLLVMAAIQPAIAQRRQPPKDTIVFIGAYSSLPTAGLANQIAIVTDCSNTSCSSGGGSTVRLMRDTGSAWAVLGDGNDGVGGGLASTDIDTSAELATILTDETGTAGGFVRATTSSTVGQVLRVGSGPTIAFGAVDLADTDAVNGVLPAANIDTAIARLASPSFTTPTLGAALATSIAFGADPADAGALRGSNNSVLLAAEIATPGTDMTLTPNSSNQWEFSHTVKAPGFAVSGGSVGGYLELTNGTSTSPSANSVILLAPTSIATAYTWTLPTAVGTTGVVHGSVSGAVATLSLSAIVDADVPNDITIDLAAAATALSTPRAIYGNNFDGSAALTQIIASTYGGTGNGFTKFSGPTTSEKTFTLPNASATILTDNAAVTVAQGGTGAGTLTGLLQGNGTSAVTAITNSSTVGQILRVTGTSTYGWGALDLADTDAVTGVLAAGNLPTASLVSSGISELATAAETTTGTDNSRAVTPDGLAGSDFGKDVIVVEVVPDATALTTGDGKAYIPIPAKHNGWLVVGVQAHVGAVVSSSGAVNVDLAYCAPVATGIRCSGTVTDVLSTNITIDANEDGTETAAAAAVIDTANDDAATGGWWRIDVDGAGTSTQGLYVVITLQKP